MSKQPKSKKSGMKLLTGQERSSLAKRAVAGKDTSNLGKMYSRVDKSVAKKK